MRFFAIKVYEKDVDWINDGHFLAPRYFKWVA